MENNLVMAVPKGRIGKDLLPLMEKAGIVPEDAFFDPDARQLSFATNHEGLTLIRVRSFDVATFVAFGAAHFGVAGSDVLMEFDSPDIYAPLDLKIGGCRLSVAEPKELAGKDDPSRWSHIRVATKYPEATRRHFAARGVQAECIKLNGAMELAPLMGLSALIVDLVDTGNTLRENGLVEVETIAQVSSRLIVNRVAYKTKGEKLADIISKFKEAVDG